MALLKCPFCEYTWFPRVLSPRSCPRCKRYFTKEKFPVEVNTPSPRSRVYKGSVKPKGVCSICGKETRVLRVGISHYCKDCLLQFLEE